MTISKRSCSGFEDVELEFGSEFRNIMDALFCACLEELHDGINGQRGELFRLTEIAGWTCAEAAHALGLDIQTAEAMLTQTRHEVAVLLALGLCKPNGSEREQAHTANDCRCDVGGLAQTRQ